MFKKLLRLAIRHNKLLQDMIGFAINRAYQDGIKDGRKLERYSQAGRAIITGSQLYKPDLFSEIEEHLKGVK